MPITTAFPFVSDIPTDPALYALYGGTGRSKHVAYIGISSNLRRRIRHHFIRQDSSVVTGTSAASLDPNLVTHIEWWLHPRFAEKSFLQAAELIAFEEFDPALRSRGRVTEEAETMTTDSETAEEIRTVIEKGPTASVSVPTLSEALSRIKELAERIDQLEEELEVIKKEL